MKPEPPLSRNGAARERQLMDEALDRASGLPPIHAPEMDGPYYRSGPRVFTCMAQPDLGRPLNHA